MAKVNFFLLTLLVTLAPFNSFATKKAGRGISNNKVIWYTQKNKSRATPLAKKNSSSSPCCDAEVGLCVGVTLITGYMLAALYVTLHHASTIES